MERITVVVPTYNEAENLRPLASALWALPIPGLKILVVDDASPDGTGKIADEMVNEHPGKISVLHRQGKLGLGSAYINGFKKAIEETPDAIVQMDADFSHSPGALPEFMKVISNADAVLGSRYVSGGSLDNRWGFGRRLLSWFGNFYSRTILKIPVLDATGGFRMWRRETLEGMPLDLIRSDGYVFQVEMAYVALKLGYNLVEFPIHFEDRRIGQSKMSFRIQIEAAIRVWQILWLHRNLSKA
jgi:dolichol-phosphate mannosyltransferase